MRIRPLANRSTGSARIFTGDCREVLRNLPAGSVHCVVTSPPYFGLRDYGTGTWLGGDLDCDHLEVQPQAREGRETPGGRGGSLPQSQRAFKSVCKKCGAKRVDRQIGLEESPDQYVAELVDVFREVRRVLHDTGVVFLNLGDSYAATTKGSGGTGSGGLGKDGMPESGRLKSADASNSRAWFGTGRFGSGGAKPKDLLGIPWRVAFALQDDGWYLRSDIIWQKMNPMPESVSDRPTKSHEYVFLLTKKPNYYYDAAAIARTDGSGSHVRGRNCTPVPGRSDSAPRENEPLWGDGATSNARSVWQIATTPFRGSHFAVMPLDLAERCIKAGSSEAGCCPTCNAPWTRIIGTGEPDLDHQRACGGDAEGNYFGQSTKGHAAHGVQDASAVKARILAGMVHKRTAGWRPTCSCPAHAPRPAVILDPFAGAGTTLLVAERLGRASIGVELNPDFVTMAIDRIREDPLCNGFIQMRDNA